MAGALYGPSGFYRKQLPTAHFRTSVSATPLYAHTLARLVDLVDEGLRRPPEFDLVDVGAGDGSLLTHLVDALPEHIRERVRPVAVEVRSRPAGLPARIEWMASLPNDTTGLVMAHEYLDNVPCDVVEQTTEGRQQVLVSPGGQESLGDAPAAEDARWMDAWWPLTEEGSRGEVGILRDRAWVAIIQSLRRGTALAVDYGNVSSERRQGGYFLGTLTGYREGHQVVPVPDGNCDITAHVAIDACAHAGQSAGAEHTLLTRQHKALRALGLSATLPRPELATEAPGEYVTQLSASSSAAELLGPGSLGSFWWLLQAKGMPSPLGSSVGSVALSG